MADLQGRLLLALKENNIVNSEDLAREWEEDHQKIVGAIKSLQTLYKIINAEPINTTRWQLTEEGDIVAKYGSHEARVYNAVPQQGITREDLMKSVSQYGDIGFSKAMQEKWIEMNNQKVYRKIDRIDDKIQSMLKKVQTGNINDLSDEQRTECKKRKLINEGKMTVYKVSKGEMFTLDIERLETELTPEMIANGSWREKKFKSYDMDALGIPPDAGHLHPLLKVRTEYRQIFLEMGFTEMPTNNFIESSFWNFDALFQPQQHPARDAHDTFFISEPCDANIDMIPDDYLKRVKKVHSEGGYGSQGHKYDWKIEESTKNILRTHTTAVSARMLYKLAQKKEFKPVKYFSIDRVFRNETTDSTHLAEFHQIEGLVADKGLTLENLMGVINEFFKKLGLTKLRFKPTYNPYTEPSMEIFSFHDGLKKWVEVGNSGVFRPEMLLPMGLPEDVSVIAWGLSLERPTMIKYKIQDIRTLIGPRVDLQMVYNNPLCRVEKAAI
ncbi:phenylalanine--tRNA ligase alpha subunit-like [Mytilus edulis]|uniref:phenylalanine--tRNA ligase alpha subunit-like n=1 Tax=Mytilus edulis TaxID=6550 RepID=UPI0039EEB8EE